MRCKYGDLLPNLAPSSARFEDMNTGFGKTHFLKSPTHWDFGLYWVFRIFYLNEQLGSLLVDLAHHSLS